MQPRMRQRGDAAGVVNLAEDLVGRGAGPRHEGGPAAAKPPFEGFVWSMRHIARVYQRPGNPRPAGGYRDIVEPGLQDGVGIQIDAESSSGARSFHGPARSASGAGSARKVSSDAALASMK